ncbi:MAG: response regulator transcription factor [Chloroflexi bacterium]|nr:response regulator transcription factor [Chloroflexota bacterium]
MTGNVRILIVDDLPRTRESLQALLATWPRLAALAEAASGEQALELAATFQPDVALMDVRMPGMDGLEATRRIKARWPEIKVIVLSLYGEYADEALAAGADAFVSKGEPAESLLAALARVSCQR